MLRSHAFQSVTRVRFFRAFSLISAVLLCVAGMGGCQSTTSDRDLVMVDVDGAIAAMQGERRIIGGRTTSVWIDARSDEEFRKGRIPGAIHMPLDTAREDHALLRGYGTLIVYGRDRASPRAIALSKLLMQLGHKDVRTLQGGFAAWQEAGRPVEDG